MFTSETHIRSRILRSIHSKDIGTRRITRSVHNKDIGIIMSQPVPKTSKSIYLDHLTSEA